MRTRLGLLAAAAALLLASGCGGGDEVAEDDTDAGASTSPSATATTSTPSGSPSASMPTTSLDPTGTPGATDPTSATPTGPACGEVWAGDATLPRGYQGCLDDSGTWVEADKLGCSSGQALIRYDGRFWGVAGGTIHETAGLDSDTDYRDAVATCRG
jgi:hypothetical protein